MIRWTMIDRTAPPEDPEASPLGYLPSFFEEADPRRAREQLGERYAHGGGWNPIRGCSLDNRMVLTFPDDPPYAPIAFSQLHGHELLAFYPHALLVILDLTTGQFEVGRID